MVEREHKNISNSCSFVFRVFVLMCFFSPSRSVILLVPPQQSAKVQGVTTLKYECELVIYALMPYEHIFTEYCTNPAVSGRPGALDLFW